MPEPARTRRAIWVAVAVAWLVVLFVGGSVPPRGTLEALMVVDKLLHSIGFGILAALWVPALAAFGRPQRRALLEGVAIAVVAGGALEVWQFFLGYRSFDLADWAADSGGAVVAAGIVRVLWGQLPSPDEAAR